MNASVADASLAQKVTINLQNSSLLSGLFLLLAVVLRACVGSAVYLFPAHLACGRVSLMARWSHIFAYRRLFPVRQDAYPIGITSSRYRLRFFAFRILSER